MPAVLPLQPVSIGDFRRDLKDHYTNARHGQPVPVMRAHDDGPALMLGADRLLEALEALSFSPEVYEQSGQIGFWLPELELYALGDDAASAEEDLLEEVREYVVDYLSDVDAYLGAPNRRAHYPFIVKAYAAGLLGLLGEVVLGADKPVAA